MNRLSTAWRWQALVLVVAMVTGSSIAGTVKGKFYPDDPLTIDPEERDASRVQPQEINHVYGGWQMIRGVGDHAPRRALNVNSMDEVPNSGWFTNRIGSHPPSTDEIARGPNRSAGPAPGTWTVVAGKSNGVTPGLQLRDSAGQRFFVKFDPPANPEMASGAEVISTKLLYALGYYVPENYIVKLRRDELVIGDGATLKGTDGRKQPLTPKALDRILQQAARRPDGSYRILASRALEGIPVGPFRYDGTRPDDPNDIVPHEHRRELRGLRVFAAWLNHVDTKAENSLDTLITITPHVDAVASSAVDTTIAMGSHAIVRHHLIDFGSTLGSGGVEPMGWRDGYEYAFDKQAMVRSLVSLGLYVPSWQRINYPDLPSVGRIDADHFRPDLWKPTLPNPAFQNARADDTFWAARRVMAFSDDAIRAVVQTAALTDPRATTYLANVLIKRRDQIGRTWLTGVNPIVSPSINAYGVLTFRNAATDAGVAAAPTKYRVSWATYDNTTGVGTPLGQVDRSNEPQCQVPANLTRDAEYLMADIRAFHPAYPAWSTSVRVFFRRDHNAWTTVGLERLPEDTQRLIEEVQSTNVRDRRVQSSRVWH